MKCPSMAFERGGVYYANPAMRDAGQLVVACVGRTDDTVTLAFVSGVVGVKVKTIEGRETAEINVAGDKWYFVSAVAKMDGVDDAGAILAAINGVASR